MRNRRLNLGHATRSRPGDTRVLVSIAHRTPVHAGGEVVNMVAPSATAALDFRYIHPADRATGMAEIDIAVATNSVKSIRLPPGTR